MPRQVVNVEAQIAKRLWEEGLAIERQARELIAAKDPLGLKRMADAEAAKRSARVAVARAKSLETGTPPEELEPVRTVELTDDETAEREKDAAEAAWRHLRDERNGLLAGSDWTQQPDSPADTAAWAKYRQKLRDLPAKTKDPAKVKWPDQPE